MASFGYNNNANLPRSDYKHAFTQHEIDEFIKCANDPVYFALNYIKIINVDRGLIPFEMWDFQKKMLETFYKERFSICKLPRQVGKTTTSVAYLLHAILFNENYNVAILANKASTAREILGRLKLAFEYLPTFLKTGVIEWNKGSVELTNGSKALADSTSGSSVRGRSFNVILLDEFAFVPNNIAESFFMSTYPTISSGKTTKVIIVSTPNSLNLFYRMWTDAVEKRSLYIPIEIHWSMVPGRDDKWKEETIRNTSEDQFRQEFECQFIGSSNTLIHPTKLTALAWHDPIRKDMGDCFHSHTDPEPGHTYTMCVDVAEGQNLDYSAFSIIDVTSFPYRLVAKYRNNNITPLLFPTVILQAARLYNDAFVLVEINSIGLQVATILHHELAYENLIKIESKGKEGQLQTPGFKKKIAFGIKTTHQTKITGCANLKTLIESDKLIINDAETIIELTTFSADKKSFKAELGNNDDLVMTLVHFGWLSGQRYFKENINSDIRKALQEEQLQIMDQDLVPFGIVDNGIDDIFDEDVEYRDIREKWTNLRSRNVFDNTEFDILSNKERL